MKTGDPVLPLFGFPTQMERGRLTDLERVVHRFADRGAHEDATAIKDPDQLLALRDLLTVRGQHFPDTAGNRRRQLRLRAQRKALFFFRQLRLELRDAKRLLVDLARRGR